MLLGASYRANSHLSMLRPVVISKQPHFQAPLLSLKKQKHVVACISSPFILNACSTDSGIVNGLRKKCIDTCR